MKSLRDSGKIVGHSESIKQIAHQCNLPFPLSLSHFLTAPRCPFPTCIRLHIKILIAPSRFSIDTMLSSMREVYSTASIRVEVVSRENLTGPQFASLLDVDIGPCVMGTTTPEQNQLFANRNNVGNNEIVVYFVRTTNPASNGCAAHPNGKPGAVVVQLASRWTLAHEVGHVLDLQHLSGEDCAQPVTRLMTDCGTDKIVGTPIVTSSEVTTMNNSSLTFPG